MANKNNSTIPPGRARSNSTIVRGNAKINNINRLRTPTRNNFHGLRETCRNETSSKINRKPKKTNIKNDKKKPNVRFDLSSDCYDKTDGNIQVKDPVRVQRGKDISNPALLNEITRSDFFGLETCRDRQSQANAASYEKGLPAKKTTGQFSDLKVLPEIACSTGPNTENAIQSSYLLPIKSYHNKHFFPYRYSSAGPSQVGGTALEQRIQECLKRRRDELRGVENVTSNLESVRQREGYETTTLTESLKPYNKELLQQQTDADSDGKLRRHNHMQTMWTLRLPYKATSQFSQGVIDELHPHWRADPRYRRRVVYQFKES